MSRFFRFLLHPEISIWNYCIALVPLALIPSFVFYLMATTVIQAGGLDVAAHAAPAIKVTPGGVLGTIVFSPICETYLLAWPLSVLLSVPLRPIACAAIAALIFGCLHMMFGALWFFGATWSFFVYSCAYLSWRRTSFRHGFLAALVPHALVNSFAVLLSMA